MYFLVLMTLLLVAYNIYSYQKDMEILDWLSHSIMVYILNYLLAAACLLTLNCFSVAATIVICTIIQFPAAIVNWRKGSRIRNDAICCNWRRDALLLLIMLSLLPFVQKKTETFSMDSDAGSYTERALNYIYGRTDNVLESIEYGMVTTPELRMEVYRQDYDLPITNFINKDRTALEEYVSDERNSYDYDLHALPLWSTLLGLLGLVFGYEKMFYALDILYILSGYFMFKMAENKAENKFAPWLTFFLMSFAPLNIYLCKINLSETLVIALVIYSAYLLMNKNNELKIMASLPLSLIAFTHISLFLYLPVIWLVLISAFYIQDKKQYGWVNLIFLSSYLVALIYYFRVSYSYAFLQFSKVSYKISLRLTLMLIVVLVCVLWTIQLVMLRVDKRTKIYGLGNSLVYFLYQKSPYIAIGFMAFGIIVNMTRGYFLAYTDKYAYGAGSWVLREEYAAKGLQSLRHINLVSIIMGTSYIAIPFVVYKLMKSRKEKLELGQFAVLTVFVYSLLVYTVWKVDTSHNYYASRYFAIFLIPSVIYLVMSFVNKKSQFIAIALLAFITALPFNIFLLNTTGYSGTKEYFNDIISLTGKDSIIFVDESKEENLLRNRLDNNVRCLEDGFCFRYSDEMLHDIAGQVEYELSHKYVVSDEPIDKERFKLLLNKKYTMSDDIGSINIIYPYKDLSYLQEVYLYQYLAPVTQVFLSEEYEEYIEDFNSFEKMPDGRAYSWSTGESKINMRFEVNKDKKVKVNFVQIPDDFYKYYDSLEVEIWIDGELVHVESITKEHPETFEFVVPAEKIGGNYEHEIEFKGDTWIPNTVIENNQDTRELGLSLTGIIVE